MSQDSHQESFITKYIFSQDHKVIGIQYGLLSLFFMLFGFSLMMIMRWQLAYPNEPIPVIGHLMFENGILNPDMYNSFGAMHGTIMIFLGVVPIVVGAFGNYLVPLQINLTSEDTGYSSSKYDKSFFIEYRISSNRSRDFY